MLTSTSDEPRFFGGVTRRDARWVRGRAHEGVVDQVSGSISVGREASREPIQRMLMRIEQGRDSIEAIVRGRDGGEGGHRPCAHDLYTFDEGESLAAMTSKEREALGAYDRQEVGS